MNSEPDVLLVYPPVMQAFAATDPPFGLMYLAAMLREAGTQVRILDLNMLRWSPEQVRSHFRSHTYRIVGIGGMTTVYPTIKWLAQLVRQSSPKTKLLGGGSFATPCPRPVLEHTALDVVSIGESESVIVDLTRRLLEEAPLDEVLGIAFKRDGEIVVTPPRPRIPDLDSLPLPAYDLVDMPRYLEAVGQRPSLQAMARRRGIPLDTLSNSFIMFSGRGCPFHCTFCYRNFGSEVHRHSVDYVVEHIRFARKAFGANNIAFYDETFNVGRRWIDKLCEVAERDLAGTYFWIGGARADLLDEELVEQLARTGVYEISVGVESFDQRVLDHMQKRLDAGELFACVERLKRHGLAPSYLGMIFGFAVDDEESLRTSERALIRLGIPAYFQFPMPFPGTPLWDDLIASGRVRDIDSFMTDLADGRAQDLHINLSQYSDALLLSMVRDAERRIQVAIERQERGRWAAVQLDAKLRFPRLLAAWRRTREGAKRLRARLRLRTRLRNMKRLIA